MAALARVLLAALLLAGCGGNAAPTREPESTEEAQQLPPGVPEECANALPTEKGTDVPGLLAPVDVILGPSAPRGPNVQVTGFVAMAPLDFLKEMKARRGWKILFEENEVSEAELLISDGKHRNFWKVVQACPTGSRFVVLVADEPRT